MSGGGTTTGGNVTSSRIATLAGRGEQNPDRLSAEQYREVCGSALEQHRLPLGTATLLGIERETSARVASIAGRHLQNPASATSDEKRSVCGSVLVQCAKRGEFPEPPTLAEIFYGDSMGFGKGGPA